jgi:hypothetical protein
VPADTGTIELKVRSDTSTQAARTYELTCRRGLQRATGSPVKSEAAALCGEARGLASLLSQKRPARRLCTQIYGGPETARITGTVDGHHVDRTFRRTNGCEIEQYARISKILPR